MDSNSTLKMIDETIEAIDRFDDLDKYQEIIKDDDRKKLQTKKEELQALRHKLDTGEMEVAVVGLEKAGKSKFSSAFVNIEGLFPSADERCTFTSTALRYGIKNQARVEFYNRKEFIDKVDEMFADVHFQGKNFEQIELLTFRRYFDALLETDKPLYNMHAAKTESDIIDILEGRQRILPLLGQEDKIFDDLASAELTSYITDKHISRAVRSVTFYANNLEGLENIVLYDVPGFDSPTLVHINQTIEKLKQVDAIVMVKNIKMPSLKGGEVDILIKNSDMDGIKLSDKLFVFGSYADAVDSLDQLDKNKRLLIGDLSKNLRIPFSPGRIFTGVLDKKYEQVLIERGGDSEIETLKNALRQYNETERAAILSKRINRNIEDIKSILRDTVEITQIAVQDRSEESSIVLSLMDESRCYIDNEIARFINPIKETILSNREFTNKVIEGIEGCMPNLDQTFIDNTLHEIQAPETRNVINYTKLNLELRGRMSTRIKEAVIRLVIDVSLDDLNAIQKGVHAIVHKALGIDNKHARYEKLSQVIENFIAKETASVSISESGFKPLVERFIVDLIDTIIMQPLGYDARRERFMKGKSDLYMLALFSNDSNFDLPYRSALVAAVLAQKPFSEKGQNLSQGYRDEFIRAMPRANGKEDSAPQLMQVLVSTLAEIAINRATPISEVNTIVKRVINHHGMDHKTALSKMVDNFQQLFSELGGDGDDLNVTEEVYLNFLLKEVKQASNREEVEKEIETDLSNLVYLFKDCVVSAMNLELPFISAITLMTERIREVFQGGAYRDFLSKHVRDILSNDFERIDNQVARQEIRSKLVTEMRDILITLERGVI